MKNLKSGKNHGVIEVSLCWKKICAKMLIALVAKKIRINILKKFRVNLPPYKNKILS